MCGENVLDSIEMPPIPTRGRARPAGWSGRSGPFQIWSWSGRDVTEELTF
jgi:hypothetical protein